MPVRTNRARVYVSGPYTSDPAANTVRAIHVGQVLLERGYAPMVPHLSHYWHEQLPNPYDAWLELDVAWVLVADAVLRMPGESSGADEEVALARAHGIPVFETWQELVAAVPATRAEQPAASIPPPVERAIERIRATFAKKNADYAEDGAWRSNFDDIAHQMDAGAVDAADTLIAVKQARLRSLKRNGRGPQNEAVDDTYLDRAVYAVIALALLMDDCPEVSQDSQTEEVKK